MLNVQQPPEDRYQRFARLTAFVAETSDTVAALSPAQRRDVGFLEHEFIPVLGLNDELLNEQPPELYPFFGKGLHLWQYPCQLAPYLAWLTENSAGITSFLEIGCRWGGMFVLVAEWIRHNGGELQSVTAVDPVERTPFVTAYFELLKETTHIQANYLQATSTSPPVINFVDQIKPEFVFIDGDHTLKGALLDHLMVRQHAKIIVHHDIHSQVCQDTTLLWKALKRMETPRFETFEFTKQYPSVKGSFLGIGAMKRAGR